MFTAVLVVPRRAAPRRLARLLGPAENIRVVAGFYEALLLAREGRSVNVY